MHLVITTREDPQLPLARLRARGQLTELRAADLRFTPSEAAEFLNQVMGLGLSAEDIAALEARTEGWIAGLQLAALSMQGREDIAGFIRPSPETTATSWTIWSKRSCSASPNLSAASYSRPPFSTGLNGPLCDAVTGQEDGNARLEALRARQLLCRSAG